MASDRPDLKTSSALRQLAQPWKVTTFSGLCLLSLSGANEVSAKAGEMRRGSCSSLAEAADGMRRWEASEKPQM